MDKNLNNRRKMINKIIKFRANPFWISHKVLLKIASISTKLARILYENKNKSPVNKWREINGDQTLSLNYYLDKNSVVLDVGGYEGQWSSDIYSKYCCSIYIFEPVKAYHEAIAKRFEQNPDIRVYPFGLLDKTATLKISIDNNSSSFFTLGHPKQEADVKKASDFFKENSINTVDLMKINIEGSEYPLLEHLIAADLIKNIKNLQIQFHSFVPAAEERMKNIQKKLSLSHHIAYQYPFVWENWERN